MAKSKTPAQVWRKVLRRVRRNIREYKKLSQEAVPRKSALVFKGSAEGGKWVFDELWMAYHDDKPKLNYKPTTKKSASTIKRKVSK